MATTDCVFCNIIAGDIPAEFLYQDDQLMVIRDRFPKAPVHVLVIPKRHIASIADIAESDTALVGELIVRAKLVAVELGVADSGYKLVFNVGADGGQVVPHIHLHLLGGAKLHE
jgi:histidine triad (HIT) family protein